MKILQFIKSDGFTKYFSNTSWILLEKIFRISINLVISIWLARYLEPNMFGLFNYCQSIIGLFSAIPNLGLDSIVVKKLVENPKESDTILGTAFLMKCIASLVTIILIVSALFLLDNSSDITTLTFILSITMLFQSLNTIEFYNQSTVQVHLTSKANILTLFISSLLKIFFILSNASIYYICFAFLIESVLYAIGLIYVYVKSNRSLFHWTFNPVKAKAYFLSATPLVLSGIVVSIYLKIDQIMIKELLNTYELGIYSAAIKVSQGWYFLPVAICTSLYPAILNARKDSIQKYYGRLQNLFTFLIWSAIIVSVPIIYLSDDIISILYGDLYKNAGYVLSIHFISSVFVFAGVASGRWYLAEEEHKLAFLRTLLGAISNIVLNYILIIKYGIIGAAYSTLIAHAISSFFFDLLFKKTRILFMLKLKAFMFKYITD